MSIEAPSNSTNLSPKQLETVEVIYKLTHKFNYPPTLDEIAAEMGITKGTLQYHMTALRKKEAVTWNPGSARSVRIMDAVAVNHCRELFPEISKADNFNGSFDNNSIRNTEFEANERSIPIMGKIAAGAPLDVMDKPNEYLELADYFPDGCYALKVKGQSMIDALINDGDMVLIEPKDEAKNGEIVVALLNNEAATLKRFYKEDGLVRLKPENPTMDDILVNPLEEDLKIQGIVKGVVRKT